MVSNDEVIANQQKILANQEVIQAKLAQVLTNQESLQTMPEMVGTSDKFEAMLKEAQSVAATDTAVLLRGETGTGKELLAHHIHARSQRRHLPLMTVNCAALPPGLIESEIFGYEKGAFSGAFQRRTGRFEVAHGGTIFLDEIGELPLETQGKFLRVLQHGTFERLGSSRTLKVDVRLIAATNQPLEHLVADRKFRPDLFYRLNVFPITLPPLRERREDILPLIYYFTKKYRARFSKPISSINKASLERLYEYHWPGNIRELQHLIERAVLIAEGEELDIVLPLALEKEVAVRDSSFSNGQGKTISHATSTHPFEMVTLEENERRHTEKVLRHTRGRIAGSSGAAAILGVPPSTLRSRMKKLGLKLPDKNYL
ncbi:MAG: sigma-54-dependent Fis family transcriptional regulator [Pyrinomonadaceae bacterium]|nr:sigma-54-dependent Fis family transcriptional regulator [Pyrinomonadaceae bacterium]